MSSHSIAALALLFGVAIAATADAAPTKPTPQPTPTFKPVNPGVVPTFRPPPLGTCLSVSPDLRIELGSRVQGSSSVEPAIYGQAHEKECPRSAIIDFVATKAAGSPLPPAPAPQSWESRFLMSVWDSRSTSPGDFLVLTNANAQSCAAFNQGIKMFQLSNPPGGGFTAIFDGRFTSQMAENRCFLYPPQRTFRGQPPAADGATVTYRVILDAPIGTVSARFAHAQTNNGE